MTVKNRKFPTSLLNKVSPLFLHFHLNRYLIKSQDLYFLFLIDEIKIWTQIDGCQATRVTLNCTSIIDDLKRVALNGVDRTDLYQAYYRNQHLGPAEQVPSNTNDSEPVLLRKIINLQPTEPGINPFVDSVIPKPVRKCLND
jgi:hypothetical protein